MASFMVSLVIALCFLWSTSTTTVFGIKPHFTSAPNKVIVTYQDQKVTFTWKLSNHSINRLYFGTWQADHGTFGKSIMSIIRNGSETPIYTSGKKEVEKYRGRVKWAGDLLKGVVSFELTNIKETDQKYYGIEVEFNDDAMTEVSGSTQLIVKARSVFTSAPSGMTQPVHGLAVFSWGYSLTREDQGSLSALAFGIYRKDAYENLCTIKISSSNCSTGVRKAVVRYSSSSPTSMAKFTLDNLNAQDEGIYSLRLEGTRKSMENKTRLFVRGTKPHFTSEPDKLIGKFPEETVIFTWKLSNHSINRLYFGTWQADHGTFGKSVMSIVRNGSETPIYTSDKKEVEEYRGRVRWAGDLLKGVVSFELTNIKETDQKYYGIEVEFDDAMMTEISGFTKLLVKSKSDDEEETNPCEVNNGGCSHVCDFSSVTKSHTCKCPSGMDLSSDGKTCDVGSQLTTVPSSPASDADVNKRPSIKTFLFILVTSIITSL